jgi:hypothetical protein
LPEKSDSDFIAIENAVQTNMSFFPTPKKKFMFKCREKKLFYLQLLELSASEIILEKEKKMLYLETVISVVIYWLLLKFDERKNFD